MIITGRGMARADGSPRDIDREIVAHFALFDEHLSWYWGENQQRIYGEPGRYDGHDKQVHDFHHFYVINGYMDGDGPMMTMHKGERVRWYMFANPNDEESWDIHTPHWHGQSAVVGHMRMDLQFALWFEIVKRLKDDSGKAE
jgi:hypothetical protein